MWMRSRGVSACAGPNHSATWSGTVQAAKTASRGASKIRVTRTSRSVAAAGIGSAIVVVSSTAQVGVEPVHAGLPGLLARLHPGDRLVERVRLQPARAPLGVPAAH